MNNNYIYLIDEHDKHYVKEKRIKEIFNKIVDEKVKIENLSIYDMIDLSYYLSNENNKLDQKIYLKNINLSLLIHELSELDR